MKVPESISEFLQLELSITPEEAEKTWNAMAKAVLFHAAFRGAVATPFGKIALQDKGLSIVEQNKELVQAVAGATSRDAVQRAITQMVAG